MCSIVTVYFFLLLRGFFAVYSDSPSTSSGTVVADSRTAVSGTDDNICSVDYIGISGFFFSMLKCLSTYTASNVSSKISFASKFCCKTCSSCADNSEDSIYSAWSSTSNYSICSYESRSSKGLLSSKDSTTWLYLLKLGLSFLLLSSCFGVLFERNYFLLLPGLSGGFNFFGGENTSSCLVD